MTATKDPSGSAATNKLYPAPDGYLADRDDRARANLRAFASWEPDPGAWYAEMTAILGLDGDGWSGSTAVSLSDPSGVVPMANRDRRQTADGCGTRAAYERHRKAGEPTCQPCKDANARYQTRGARRGWGPS